MTIAELLDGPPTLPLWPDAAKALGIGKDGVYRAARNGEIPVLKLGRTYRVPRAALLRLLGLDLDLPRAVPEHDDAPLPASSGGAVFTVTTTEAEGPSLCTMSVPSGTSDA